MIGNSAYIITSPDDKFIDGVKILCVDLVHDQSQLISNTLINLNPQCDLALYVWKSGDNIDWLLDKKDKSDIIFFNAESIHQSLIGYLAAHKKSYYFGILKDIDRINNKAIYNVDFLKTIMGDVLKNNEKLY